jgi:hypothetical protein
MGRMPTQASIEGLSNRSTGVIPEFGQMQIPTLAFQTNSESVFALPGYDGIGFPMARLLSLQDIGRPSIDRNAAGNMAFSVFSSMAPPKTLSMGAGQAGNQGDLFTDLRVVDILIDRFVADAQTRTICRKPPCNLLG